ncbi:MAG: hypothetical protein LBQ02_01175 [Candidatus Nomurabacteria bacterium]|nr:hypothetical protein [Candidatus Nomurabacteria bacterium]
MSEAKEKARLRDVQRKEDMSRLATAVFHYEAKHRGALPDFSDANLNPDGACLTDDSGEPVYAKSFCGSYLIVNDTFADPSGVAYNIVAVNNYNGAGGSVFPAVVDYPLKIENDEILMVDVSDYKDYGYRFYVIYGATCNKEVAVATDKERKFAALYKLEQGGAICQSN